MTELNNREDTENTRASSPPPPVAPSFGVVGTQAILLAGVGLLASGVATGNRRLASTAAPADGGGPNVAEPPSGPDESATVPQLGGEVTSAGAIDGVIELPVPTVDGEPAASAPTPAGEPEAADGGAEGKEPRRRRRSRAVDEEGEEGDAFAGLSPMVRHLSAMTKELSEAQRTVGRLTAERDLLRRQLADRQGVPISLVDGENGNIRPAKEARIEAKAAKQTERANGLEPMPSPEDLVSRAQLAGRRRRLIALGVVASLVAAILIGRAMDVAVGEYLTKQGLDGIPYFGLVFQVLITCFMVYRVVRVSGKAKGWLFPTPEEPKKRRR